MIHVERLTHIYPSGKGVFELTFSIPEGEVFGFLGPNGAGKTTTIRNLMGFVNPNDGWTKIDGLDCRIHAARLQESIGYLPGEMAFFEAMTGSQFLKFMGDMRRMAETRRRDDLIDRFQLETEGRIRKMSKGMKQKLGIIAAFMHDPSVYILDEPTSGLDPFMQNTFMELVSEERGRGKTIMMSSHIFEEVERSCDRAGIIRDGRLVAVEDIHALRAMKRNEFIVEVEGEGDVERVLDSPLEAERLAANTCLVQVGSSYERFLSILSGCHVQRMESRQQSLEDIFMKYYGREEA